jgi:hypothetical protein
MFEVDKNGMIIHSDRIPELRTQRMIKIERGTLNKIAGIVIHQTGSASVSNTINSYANNTINEKGESKAPNGAHFLISKEGQVIQAASLNQQTQHVGYIKNKKIAEWSCAKRQQVKGTAKEINDKEMLKDMPDRYPSNSNSVGIEMVGLCILPDPINTSTIDCFAQTELRSYLTTIGVLEKGAKLPLQVPTAGIKKQYIEKLKDIAGIYENITDSQQTSLGNLMEELVETYDISWSESYRHPTVSPKNNTEAASAKITQPQH